MGKSITGALDDVQKLKDDLQSHTLEYAMTATLTDLLLSVRMERAGMALVEIADSAHIRIESVDRVIAYFVLEGNLHVVDPNGNKHQAGAHDFILFPHGARHKLLGSRAVIRSSLFGGFRKLTSSDQPARIRLGRSEPTSALVLCSVFGLERPERTRLSARLPPFMLMHDKTLQLTSDRRLLQGLCEGAGSGAFTATMIYLLFLNATRSVFNAAGNARAIAHASDIATLSVPTIAASLGLLDRQLEKNWTVAELAVDVGMSRSTFAAAFTQAIGQPPLTYLANLRMLEADKLLQREDDLAIGTIAAQVGYQSQAAFTRAYRRHFGIAPSERRKGSSSGEPDTANNQ
ncbi:putative AraC family transcriptional regulator [Pseudomonas sp. 9AZ]|uniref:AraC family transcriptional regulator n=1 Tax=Pseudomonas sp. 9AZ TaxID=2653168 RepID=UPI0012EF01F7|nr:AraC family transcriptional regulator [Pseudomonas sp. 9AZ]VXD04491.1 putative AraC family transcriptional regulator [Pseudomonas sp. 9AZ]